MSQFSSSSVFNLASYYTSHHYRDIKHLYFNVYSNWPVATMLQRSLILGEGKGHLQWVFFGISNFGFIIFPFLLL